MLKRIRSHLGCHWRAATSSLNGLLKEPLSSLLTVVVIAVALALPALFWVFTNSVRQVSGDWQHTGRISLYLKHTVSVAGQNELLGRITGMQGVGKATLVTPEQGLSELKQQEGMNDVLRYLPQNPLPALIEVIPSLSLNQHTDIERLYATLKQWPEVDMAKLDLQWMNRFNALLALAVKLSKGLMLLLGSAVILIIGNTLRLAIQNRYEEIQILKLIGATDAYILRPFLYSGLWYGLAGAIAAILLVNIFLASLAIALNHVAKAYQMHDPLVGLSLKQTALMMLITMGLGWLGAKFSVRRQLSAIEPYQ